MGIKRIVDTGFWEDEKVMEMFSPEDKLFFLYLMTNPHSTQLGIYKILDIQMAFEIGYSKEAIKCLLDRFENKYGIIKYSESTKEIAIKNYLVYSIVKGGKPVYDLLVRESQRVKDKSLFDYILEGADKSDIHTVKEFCKYLKMKKDNDNDVNDNDNDNDVSSTVHRANRPPYSGAYTNRDGDNIFLQIAKEEGIL